MRLVPKKKAVAGGGAGGGGNRGDNGGGGGAVIAAATADATARFFSVRFLPNLVRAENSPNRRREICVRRVAPPCGSGNGSTFPVCLRGAWLGRNHFNLPTPVVETLHRSFAHTLRNQRAYIQLGLRFVKFFCAGVKRRGARHKDRTTIVERFGGSLIRPDLARRGENLHLIGSDQRA